MITYNDKCDIKEKINNLFDELLNDDEFNYTISIQEGRTNSRINELKIEVINIQKSMPNF